MPKHRRPATVDQERPARLEFRFLLAGAQHSDAARIELQDALHELLPQAVHLNLLPVNQGLHLDLELSSIAPFGNADYEAYLVDHILTPVLQHRVADGADGVRIKPLRSRRT